MTTIKQDAYTIIQQAIEAVLPEAAVKKQLETLTPPGNITLVAIGKAAWRMAQAATAVWGERIARGVVITKYDHAAGDIPGLEIFEAGHPLPDANGIAATQRALEMTSNLTAEDTVLFLVSGGGSALFEALAPGISLADLTGVTDQLLKSGANIVEINTMRKRLSAVKGGRFARHVAPGRVLALVLSDVLGDRLDSIASGPAHPDATTAADAQAIVEKYRLDLPPVAVDALQQETPKSLDNVETHIIGSVRVAADAAAAAAARLGYRPLMLTTTLDCEAREAGRFMAAIAREVQASGQPVAAPCAIVLGGETVVTVTGDGLGGRNQELALAAAIELEGSAGVVIASVGTDGTDGPNDAAGGVVDGSTASRMRANGIDPLAALQNNDAYHALAAAGDLLKTGPTGTNVNDVSLALVG
jgi:hydroxypyruvate reductase